MDQVVLAMKFRVDCSEGSVQYGEGAVRGGCSTGICWRGDAFGTQSRTRTDVCGGMYSYFDAVVLDTMENGMDALCKPDIL
jgi:hypothetical protein